MKKSLYISLAFIILASCSPAKEFSGEILPSDEVMKKAANASLEIDSFAFNASAEFKTEKTKDDGIDGSFSISGRSDAGGEQMELNIHADIKMINSGDEEQYLVDSAIRILGPKEVYFLINSYKSSGGSNLFLSDSLLSILEGKWWSLGSNVPSNNENITPDPKLLNAQAQVVNIEKEHPISFIDGSYHYHYSVSIDPEKFVDFLEEVSSTKDVLFDKAKEQEKIKGLIADGELWIDAKTFLTKKIVWNLSSKNEIGGGEMQANLNVTFSDWGNVESISPPENAKIFEPATLLESLMDENNIDGLDSDALNSMIPSSNNP